MIISLNSFKIDKFSPVINLLKDKHFVYFRNPGNFGDSLIRAGTIRLFNDCNFDYLFIDSFEDLFNRAEFKKGKYKTFVFSGGGAWCKLYFLRSKEIIEKASEIFDEIIILPSTYENNQEIKDFINSHEKITFFRRDDFISKESAPNSILCPDLALYISKVNISNDENLGLAGNFFRIDQESAGKISIKNIENTDLSIMGDDKTDISIFFNNINYFKKIYTDRLHVAIAGYLLNKEVFMYDNSYHKNKSFYKTFFMDKPNIKFLD